MAGSVRGEAYDCACARANWRAPPSYGVAMTSSRAPRDRSAPRAVAGVAALLVALTSCINSTVSQRVTTSPVASLEPSIELPPPPEGGFDPPVRVEFDGAPPLRAEVARRQDQRSRGLMQRTSLGPTEGMVFLFPDRSNGGFYMLGTLIPLSIAYVDGDRVVSTTEMTPCPGADCPTYPPAAPYTMAVEAPAGFFPKWGVRAGTKVRVIGRTAPPE